MQMASPYLTHSDSTRQTAMLMKDDRSDRAERQVKKRTAEMKRRRKKKEKQRPREKGTVLSSRRKKLRKFQRVTLIAQWSGLEGEARDDVNSVCRAASSRHLRLLKPAAAEQCTGITTSLIWKKKLGRRAEATSGRLPRKQSRRSGRLQNGIGDGQVDDGRENGTRAVGLRKVPTQYRAVMPGMVVFRRRWSVGSDDLVLPALFLFLLHCTW
ncbi:hypothetical protein SKAU_G00410340 [Synaphobranchus kaupii]|uniref:Uncharacterized protein n=1 Tax=Synaphobranchus kaupii TaxID=118154 RepID=A0A9Q1E7N7_SYNKA|nr:hypothetical protein SKAU_G00410340 [Synaphobranchus kaupii]